MCKHDCCKMYGNSVLIYRVKNDEKYEDVLSRLVFLLSVVSEAPSHVQAQESVVVSWIFKILIE